MQAIRILAAALAVAPGAIGAADLARAEGIKLHIAASGISVNPPDQVTILVPIVTKGETLAAATQANKKRQEDVTAKLVAGGIDRSMIKPVQMPRRMGFVGSEIFDESDMPVLVPGKTATSQLKITYGNPTLTPRFRQVIEDVCQGFDSTPQLKLLDDSEAKSTAIANGLANARKDADAYAAALGMKVSGIRAVSNVQEQRIDMFDMENLMQAMTEREPNDTSNVTTRAYVTVDFDLVPR